MMLHKRIGADPKVTGILLVSLLLNAGIWWLAAELAGQKTTMVPLHYTIYYNINLSGPTYLIYTLPSFGLVMIAVHWLIGRQNLGRLWRVSWAIVGLVMQVLLLATATSLVIISR